MGLGDAVLSMLFGGKAESYRSMRRMLYAPTSFSSRPRKENNGSLYTTLARLKKNGLVAKRGENWSITQKGKGYVKKKEIKFLPSCKTQNIRVKKQCPKNMIIAFDIPESIHQKRRWLRTELTFLGFTPIQKSVWLGHSPLPRQFVRNLDDLELLNFIKFFRAEEKEIV